MPLCFCCLLLTSNSSAINKFSIIFLACILLLTVLLFKSLFFNTLLFFESLCAWLNLILTRRWRTVVFRYCFALLRDPALSIAQLIYTKCNFKFWLTVHCTAAFLILSRIWWAAMLWTFMMFVAQAVRYGRGGGGGGGGETGSHPALPPQLLHQPHRQGDTHGVSHGNYWIPYASVGDPDPQDPRVFGPPGSVSISQEVRIRIVPFSEIMLAK